jgi:two-component system LytT family response regulator
MLRVLIVDDEPLARTRLRDLLRPETDMEVVGEAEDGVEAVEALARLEPDLLFLDIQMPGLDGFGVLEQAAFLPPAIVFVTAFDKHALRAFDVHAMDYLLKPFEVERFDEALGLVRSRLQTTRTSPTPTGDPSPDWRAMLLELRQQPAHIERVAIRLGDRISYVRLQDVDWIEAEGNYVRLHVRDRSHLLRRALRTIAEELDPKIFARIHRSSIVNIDRISEMRPLADGDYSVLLTTGVKLKLSKRYRDALPPF